jgi:hypothetical protein
MHFRTALILAACPLMMAACNNSTETEKTETVKDSVAVAPRPAVTLGDFPSSPEFAGASLAMGTVKAQKAGNDSAKVSFAFTVKNYELKMQTADTGTKLCANSAQGQHIHFILDNKPYKALYEPANDVTLANNTEHTLVAFLSRSYHESIKSAGAAVVYHFKIDEKGNLKKTDDPKTPMLVYSRPKGDYYGKDTANVMLDFYLVNCTLAADGYKVKADVTPVSGTPTSFTLDKWAPKFIHNLPMGKNTIVLSLIDKDGKVVENNTISRDINLAAQEAAK